MLTVATVLKSGGIYTPEWVAKLKAGVEKHLTLPHRFVCLSDVEVPCERIPLEHNWPGWWSKLELFRLDGPVLYFDLDTAIVGDLSEIAEQAEKWTFTLLRDFYRLGDALGSGMMSWNVDLRRLYDEFALDPNGWQKRIGSAGDQGFIEQNVNLKGVSRWQDVCGNQVASFKVHCREKQVVPKGTRVVCFHGEPKTLNLSWLYDNLSSSKIGNEVRGL